MPVALVIGGTSYPYPVTGDQNWGTGATAWAQAVTQVIGGPQTAGQWTSPVAIVAIAGVPFSSTLPDNLLFVNGSGGPVTVTASTPVALPTAPGQRLLIICTDSTNTVTLNSGTGLLLSGDAWVGSQGSALQLLAVSATQWLEIGRSQL